MYLWKIRIDFHNRSNYDHYFIIKELAEEFEKQFACLGENTEKYKTFTFPIEKGVKRINEEKKIQIYIYIYIYINWIIITLTISQC